MHTLHTERNFHPVGQGLFASGQFEYNNSQPFRWVYDCGTESDAPRLKDQLDELCGACGDVEKPVLNLLAISHFDRDHVSGIPELLKRFQVHTILLPFMPLWQSVAAALQNGADKDEAILEYFVDPITYFARQDNAQIRQIIFVKPSSGKCNSPIDSDNFKDIEGLQFEAEAAGESEAPERSINSHARRKFQVFHLKKNTRLLAGPGWEFVPYNDLKAGPPITPAFVKAVTKEKVALLSGPCNVDRRDAIRRLRRIYDKHFGHSAMRRNIISLFLYAGPTADADCFPPYTTSHFHNSFYPAWRRQYCHSCCATLYTGDGYLNTRSRLNALTTFLGGERVDRIGCLQVMHHGSKTNWHEGVAAALRPCVSVFSCDPEYKSYKHPHGPVTRDFLPYGPVHVNKEGLSILSEHCMGAS